MRGATPTRGDPGRARRRRAMQRASTLLLVGLVLPRAASAATIGVNFVGLVYRIDLEASVGVEIGTTGFLRHNSAASNSAGVRAAGARDAA